MAKISVDIEYIKESLSHMGYVISDFREISSSNGVNWHIKFSNSGAVVTVYDTNKKGNTVVNGKYEDNENKLLKYIVEALKWKELEIDTLNKKIVELINSKKEDSYYDFKQEWYEKGKEGDFLHDILCLSNNIKNVDAFLIIGVTDDYDVIGVADWKKSNEVYDFLRDKKFAGGHKPEIELHKIYYKFYKLDVIVMKSSKNVPFYLEEKYRGVGTQIYTRVGDTNTPKNESANYNDIEKLWRIHFTCESE